MIKKVPIASVVVSNGRRATRNVPELADSIRQLGLLNPITVTEDMRLVAGGNRLAACRSLGWEAIPATVVKLDKLYAELAEIDENLVRNELSALEFDENMARRKEIHEALNPASKHGGAPGKAGGGKKPKDDKLSSFAEETAAKIGVSTRTVQRAVQVATSIPKTLRDEIRDTSLADNKTDLQKLARLEPKKQAEVVKAIVADPKLTVPQAQREVARVEKRAEMEAKAAAVAASPEPTVPAWSIAEGDCLEALKAIEPGSVRLVFADPPYNIGVDYGDHHDDAMDPEDFMEWSEAWMRAAAATLAPDGSMWVLINDEWADVYGCLLRDVGLVRRAWIKWYESFGVNCSRNFNRTSRHLFYMVKDPKRLVFHAAAVSRPSDRQAIYGDKRADPGGKVWDDVWGINPPIPRVVGTAKERIPDFPTQLPLALLSAVVGCASDPGDLVLDPFNGSGTTGEAALRLGRRYAGIELSPEFARLARLRLAAVTEVPLEA